MKPRYYRKPWLYKPQYKEEINQEALWRDITFHIDWGHDKYVICYKNQPVYEFVRSMENKVDIIGYVLDDIAEYIGINIRDYIQRAPVPTPIHQLYDRGIPQSEFYWMVVSGIVNDKDYELR